MRNPSQVQLILYTCTWRAYMYDKVSILKKHEILILHNTKRKIQEKRTIQNLKFFSVKGNALALFSMENAKVRKTGIFEFP